MRRYFPGLNALRVYAALSVVVWHILGPNTQSVQFFFLDGDVAVTLFFVLSGFLITYILLEERRDTGTISLRHFYIRRTARIWPLYYVIVFVAVFVMPVVLGPHIPELIVPSYGVVALVLFVPEIPAVMHEVKTLGSASPTWSIGVEELFYLLWPVLVKRYRVPVVCTVIIVARTLLDPLLFVLHASPEIRVLAWFLRFDCMALGALTAWAVFHQHPALRRLYRPSFYILSIVLFAGVIFAHGTLPLRDQVGSLSFAFLILQIATNPKPLLRLDHPVTDWLAQRSYGIYMWHFTLAFVLRAIAPDAITAALLVIPVTIVVSALSYRWLEYPFLSLGTHSRKPVPPLPTSESLGENVAGS